MSWWNQKFTVEARKKKEKQNGLTKPKGYYKGIGAFYIGKIVASQSNHTQKKKKKKKKKRKKGQWSVQNEEKECSYYSVLRIHIFVIKVLWM